MTDIPELQHLLIDAAVRRRRRARVQSAVVGTVALGAAAVFAVVALGAPEAPDREIPAVAPAPTATATATATAPTPTTVEEAYGVFRRPATAEEADFKLGREGHVDVRLIATGEKSKLFLARRGEDLCLVSTTLAGRLSSVGCGPAETYLDGTRPQGSYSDEEGPSTIAFAFPDGVEEVTVTLADESSHTYPVETNGFLANVKARPARMQWLPPGGAEQTITFTRAPEFRAQDFYEELGGRGEDAIPDLPGSRQIMSDGSTSVILVPRAGSVCLVVRDGTRETSGCRRKVADVRDPLVVGLDLGGGRRAVAAAFANGFSRIELAPDDDLEGHQTNQVLLFTDDGRAGRTLSYRSPGRTNGRLELPAGAFVLGATEESPSAIPKP